MTISPNQSAQKPSWIFWSTRESIENDVVSVTAILETIMSTTLYFWIAIYLQTYALMLAAILIAPLWLLRSEFSEALGVKWFREWERRRWEDKRPYSRLDQWERLIVTVVVAAAGLLSITTTLFLTEWIVFGAESWNELLRAAIIGWITIAGVVVATAAMATVIIGSGTTANTIMKAVVLAIFGAGVGATLGSGAIAGAGAILGALLVTVLAPLSSLGIRQARTGIVGKIIEIAGTSFSILCMPVPMGNMLGVALLGITIRFAATTRYIASGFRTMPDNFFRLMLCTSPAQAPELIPTLAGNTSFSTLGVIAEVAAKNQFSGRIEKQITTIFFFPIFALLAFPSFLFRILLKSTCWFWWPLAYLGGRVWLPISPEYYTNLRLRSLWARLRFVNAALLVLGFILANILPNDRQIAFNPLASLRHIFSFNDARPQVWQMLLLAIALLGLLIPLAIKYVSYVDTKEFSQDSQTIRERFNWIERLARLQNLLTFGLWLAVGIHLISYANSLRCWIILPPYAERWMQSLFGIFMSASNCTVT